VVARRLAENPDVSVLLLEAGGSDEVASVIQANQWPLNLGSERDWNFRSEPDSSSNGRALPLSMGKALGGGSSINLMVWARGHRNDWEHYAFESGEPAWGYGAVLDLYRQIEDWHGPQDPMYRGTGGPVFVQPAPDPHPLAMATVDAARAIGIPTYQSPNGRLMEEKCGASITDMRMRDGKRQSVFRSYLGPYLDKPNLTVVTEALVTKVLIEGSRAAGVETTHAGRQHRIVATTEVVLSLGAIHTPKVLMQSGIGDESELRSVGIDVLRHLPGVGRNFQDHFGFDCVWQFPQNVRGNVQIAATMFWDSGMADFDGPDLFACMGTFPKATPKNAARFKMPDNSWALFGAPTRPKSRGRVRVSGPRPSDPVRIETNALSHPDDRKLALACIETLREIGNSATLRPYVRREVMPGGLAGAALEDFLRDAVTSHWHHSGTAKMGRDPMSVVDGHLKVHDLDGLRVADASIMPRVTSGNTMAPCVVIGERAAQFVKADHHL
jgi:choline dehydrogenase